MTVRRALYTQNFLVSSGIAANQVGAWTHTTNQPAVSPAGTSTLYGGGGRFTSVDARFAVQDKCGLFTHADSGSLTNGIEFFISYSGSATLFTLKLRGASVFGDPSGVFFDEAAMPSWMVRGTVYDWRLGANQVGFHLVAKKTTDTVYRPVLSIPHIFSTGSYKPRDGALSDVLGPARNVSGFIAKAAGVQISSMTINVVPTYGDAAGAGIGGFLPLFRDSFTGAAGTYDASAADLWPANVYNWFVAATPTTNLTRDGSGNLVMQSAAVNTYILTPGTNIADDQTAGGYAIQLKGIIGKPVLKIVANSTRNLYFNSTVDAGALHSVSLETNGTI